GGAGELPTNADRLHHLKEAGAAAFPMLGQASLQVLAGAQIMLGVPVEAIKVEQVHHHVFLLLGEGCGPSPSAWLLAFAVAPIGELVAKPAGAAGVALVPAHGDLVLGTPTRVLFVRRSGALVVRLRRGVLAGPIAAGRRLGLHGGGHGRGDLLVEGPGRGRPLLPGPAQGWLARLLAGGRGGLPLRPALG